MRTREVRERLFFLLVAAAGGVYLTLGTTTRSEASPDVPQQVQYQGRLVDSNGVPLEGGVARLAFRLYSTATPSSASFLWGEVHQSVSVRRGVFTVHLGDGQAALDVNGTETPGPNPLRGKFNQTSRYLQVQVDSDAPLSPLSRLASVPFALSSAGDVPVGGVIDWFRPDLTTAVPDGWAVCDGSTISDPDSPFNGKALPNLVGRFVRGLNPAQLSSYGYAVGSSSPSLPDLGGQSTIELGHNHSVPHDHGMTHTHDNAHTHTVTGRTGGANQDPPQEPSPSYQGGPFVHQHNFTATTGAASPSTTGPSSTTRTSFDSPGSSFALGTTSILPPYVGMLKIMRIR